MPDGLQEELGLLLGDIDGTVECFKLKAQKLLMNLCGEEPDIFVPVVGAWNETGHRPVPSGEQKQCNGAPARAFERTRSHETGSRPVPSGGRVE
jgi:hypothetical protein